MFQSTNQLLIHPFAILFSPTLPETTKGTLDTDMSRSGALRLTLSEGMVSKNTFSMRCFSCGPTAVSCRGNSQQLSCMSGTKC